MAQNEEQKNNIQMKLPNVFDYTPLNKLNNNLIKYMEQQEISHEQYTFAILLTTGALNPIHLGHIDIMEAAKQEIEKNYKNIKNIGGFMSPSHDQYLDGKFGKNKYILSEFRIKMFELATTESDWIACDEWECKQDYFVDFPYVSSEMVDKMCVVWIMRISAGY